MNHKVISVAELYSDSKMLLNNVNGGQEASVDTILNNLRDGINNLKTYWEGADAGVQIEKVIVAFNAMAQIGNVLASLSVSASQVASKYRNIQIANQANLESFAELSYVPFQMQDDYTDQRDTVNISNEANDGKRKIDIANEEINVFIENINRLYNKIMDNWVAGTGRDDAQAAFTDFIKKSNVYRENLSSVSTSITNALKNYTF